jgi:hypothetical protein
VAAEAADAGGDPQAAVNELLWRSLALARDRLHSRAGPD